MERRIEGTFTEDVARALNAGDSVLYTGTVYTARDAAHARLVAALEAGGDLPFELRDSIIYYAGPAPAKPGMPIGSVGPTSSYRMDPYAPVLLDAGNRGIIGKGARGPQVVEALVRNGGVYFAAVGGIAALMARSVASAEVIAYEELGTEAVRKLEVADMPLTVAVDSRGGNVYEQGPASYLASLG